MLNGIRNEKQDVGSVPAQLSRVITSYAYASENSQMNGKRQSRLQHKYVLGMD